MPRKKKASTKTTSKTTGLPVTRPKVAGIDIGAREHWVCAPPQKDGEPNVRVFATTTAQLEKLARWLRTQGVDSVAMESTSVYWIPVYELLESRGIEVVLVNARQLHHVPGRTKTDMKDCQWIQRLHSCGLLRGSFRPGESICQLRALQRQCATLVEQRSRAIQWMQKALDQMNVQVHHAVSDLSGKTGMDIVRAIVAGQRNPATLAKLRDKRCRKSEEQIAEHLEGTWREEHLFNLRMALQLYDQLEAMISAYRRQLDKQMQQLVPPERRRQEPPGHPNPIKQKAIIQRGEENQRVSLWRFAGVDLTRIDGISTGAAQLALTEIGLDLANFPTEKHFVSWLRLNPKMAVSAGKPLPKKRNGTGATRVAGVLRMAAFSLQRSKTALGANFRRLARKKGISTAVFATARKLAVLIYRMLRYGQHYFDEGASAYEARFAHRRLQTIKTIAASMGYELQEVAPMPQVSG